MLEPYEGKLSRTVLRGESGSNTADLPDQTLERKQRFISQVMSGRCPSRSMEDIDESVLSFAQIKALAISDPRFMEKSELEMTISRLKTFKTNHQSQIYAMEDKLLHYYPLNIKKSDEMIRRHEEDLEVVQSHPQLKDSFTISVQGATYTNKEDAYNAIQEACKMIQKPGETIDLGEYRGFKLTLLNECGQHCIDMKHSLNHRVDVSENTTGLFTRMNNALENIEKHLIKWKNTRSILQSEEVQAQEEIKRPFPKEAELKQKIERLAQLNAELLFENKPEGQQKDDVINEKKSVIKTIQQLDKIAPPLEPKENNLKSRQAI